MYDLITIGDIKLDTFVTLPPSKKTKLLKREGWLSLAYGAKIPVTDFEEQIAGSAPNVAVGVSRLGYKTAIYSVMGGDDTTVLAYAKLQDEKVDTQYIETKPGMPSSYSAVINYQGERTILASHQPFHYHLPKIQKPEWIYIGELGNRYEEMYQQVIDYIKKDGVKLAINPGAIQLSEKKQILFDLISETDLLIVNKNEAKALANNTRKDGIEYLIHRLWKLGPEIVVITDGANGTYVFNGIHTTHCQVFPAKVKEMTGAGDSFAAGFLGALLANKEVGEAVRWGNANSASVIQYVGPQPGLLTRGKINTRLKKHKTIIPKQL
ncbi:MAG: carbohydrate kinase family protein [Candidatus Uhrbacteria bacterium]